MKKHHSVNFTVFFNSHVSSCEIAGSRNQMCFVIYGLGLSTCTLQTGEDKRSKNAFENLELMFSVLTLRKNIIFYKIRNMRSNFLDGKWD